MDAAGGADGSSVGGAAPDRAPRVTEDAPRCRRV